MGLFIVFRDGCGNRVTSVAGGAAGVLQGGMEQSVIATGSILGVILAGGIGRRMGGVEKAKTVLAGKPLATRVAERLTPQLAPGRLVLNANGPEGHYAALGLPVVRDDIDGRTGPLAGLLAAMRAAPALAPGVDWVLSAPTDTPFLPRDLVARLAAEADATGAGIVLAASAGGLCQVCGLWPVRLASDIVGALARGHNKVLDFVDGQRWSKVMFPLEAASGGTIDPFFNINTPQDLERASQFLGGEPV